MEQDKRLQRQNTILNQLNQLPRKMLLLHGYNNMTEFVLHELCNDQCFNIEKAAYFVDNPDFDCLKGIAGFWRPEAYTDNIWKQPSQFTAFMQGAPFNQKVRSFYRPSMCKSDEQDEKIIQTIAQEFGLKNPSCFSWDMKHYNHGLFVYEKQCKGDECTDYVKDGLCLLGFCPVF